MSFLQPENIASTFIMTHIAKGSLSIDWVPGSLSGGKALWLFEISHPLCNKTLEKKRGKPHFPSQSWTSTTAEGLGLCIFHTG